MLEIEIHFDSKQITYCKINSKINNISSICHTENSKGKIFLSINNSSNILFSIIKKLLISAIRYNNPQVFETKSETLLA